MRFDNAQVFNIEGAMRGMRFPMKSEGDSDEYDIGIKDLALAKKLRYASEVDNLAHSKFLRQILVSVDISAPLYFWTEMDTYKIGTTANSESTMHKLRKELDEGKITASSFEIDEEIIPFFEEEVIPYLSDISHNLSIEECDKIRLLKQVLPCSFIQKRHWTANYEVIRNIYKQRKNHRLLEWNTAFTDWVKELPYAYPLIIGEDINGK